MQLNHETVTRMLERHRPLRDRLLAEILRRQLSDVRGWSYFGTQFSTESTSSALLALSSSPSSSSAIKEDGARLLTCRRLNGTWAATDGAVPSVWATAWAVNALIAMNASQEPLAAALTSLIRWRPLEASWLARLKFRFSDRQVRFDPTKYGWPWVPDTVSWVVPTSMALIALERAKRRGLVGGKEVETRLRLGAEMLLDRACVGGGWNAGNAVVYGVPLRPHIDATAIALAALRLNYQHPTVRGSLTWLVDRVQCPSAYSLAWLVLATAAYRGVSADVVPAMTEACNRLAALVDDPRSIQDTSTIALAALALGADSNDNPFEVNA
jgi:hypothetical protein